MAIAERTSSTSPELGRRVGAALVKHQSIVAVGANIHPQTASVPAIDSSFLDIHELVGDMIRRLSLDKSVLTPDARAQFKRNADGYVEALLKNALRKAKVRDLTEFQVTVHAEMAALMAALKNHVDVAGAIIYVTAFPCHNCAKHLLALGLKVVYLDPYPKSRAEAMYGRAIGKDFRPFTGVAPRRFSSMFTGPGERKGSDGQILSVNQSAEPYLPGSPSAGEVVRREQKVVGASPKVEMNLE